MKVALSSDQLAEAIVSYCKRKRIISHKAEYFNLEVDLCGIVGSHGKPTSIIIKSSKKKETGDTGPR